MFVKISVEPPKLGMLLTYNVAEHSYIHKNEHNAQFRSECKWKMEENLILAINLLKHFCHLYIDQYVCKLYHNIYNKLFNVC